MRRILTRGLVAAMALEEEVAVAAVAPAANPAEDLTPIIDHSETVETGLMEIADNEAAATMVDEQTEEAADVATALEGIAVALEAAAGNGGLSKDAASAVGIAVDHLKRRVGIDTAKRTMPALESYGTVQSRVVATQLAMEDVKETAKKIWAAIVEAIKKSIAWLVERWQLFFGTAEKLKARAEKLAAAAGKATGEAKVKELDNAGLVAALHVGGKVDGLPAHLETAGKVVAEEFGGIEKRMEALVKCTQSNDMQAISAAFAELIAADQAGATEAVGNPEAEGLHKPAEGVELQRSVELPGGKAIFDESPKGGDPKTESAEELAKIMGQKKRYVGDFSSKSKPADGTKLPVLTPADLAKLAQIVAAMSDTLAKFNDQAKKIGEEKKAVVAKAEEFAKKESEGEKSEGEQAFEKVMRATILSSSRIIDTPVAGLSVYTLNTGKKVLDYVTLALSEGYGMKVEAGDGKADEKPAAPAPEKKEGDAAAAAA